MKKILLVLVNEFRTTVFRKSFLIMLFLIPVVGFVITWFVGGFGQSSQPQQFTELLVPSSEPEVLGLVDYSAVVNNIPEYYQNSVIQFASEEEALTALNQSKITAYYMIQPNYIEEGQMVLVHPDFNPIGGSETNYIIEDIITSSLLENDPQLAQRILMPMDIRYEIRSPEPQRDPGSALTFFLPYVVTMIFYVVILGSSSLMLNSVTNEKSNRVIEILMTSITPTQMLTGKIIALGLVGLLQTLVWSGAGYALLLLSGRSIELGAGFMLPPSIILWGILFFLAGYALYASLMAGVGALVPNLREASQATTVVIIPLVIPMVFLSPIIENPNGSLATVVSLIPFTAPVSMMTRLSAGSVPIWQCILSLVLLFGTAYLIIRSVAGFFRASNLLSGEAFNLKRFAKALFGNL